MITDRMQLSDSFYKNIKERINDFLENANSEVLLFVHDVLEEGDSCPSEEVHRLSHIHNKTVSLTIKFQNYA